MLTKTYDDEEARSFEVLDSLFYAKAKKHFKQIDLLDLEHRGIVELFRGFIYHRKFHSDIKKLKKKYPYVKAFAGIDISGKTWLFLLPIANGNSFPRIVLIKNCNEIENYISKKFIDSRCTYEIFKIYKTSIAEMPSSLNVFCIEDQKEIIICKDNEDPYEALVKCDLGIGT